MLRVKRLPCHLTRVPLFRVLLARNFSGYFMNMHNQPSPIKRTSPPGLQQTLEEQYYQLQLRATLAEQLTDASIDCVVAMDLEGRVIYWNETCMHFSGIKRDEINGKKFVDFFPAMGVNEAVVKGFEQAKLGRKVFIPAEPDVWLRGHFEIHLVPLKKADGETDGILLIAHDVAHRVKAELELKELNKKLAEKYAQLERANAELATFTHITSHDLKSPLRKIYSSLEKTIMEEGAKISLKGRGTIRKVQSTVQRLGLLADSLTTFSELQHDLEEQVPLGTMVQDALNQLKPQIMEQEAVVHVGELPLIKGNREQLRTLFVQLLSNAVKFHDPGTKPVVEVHASRTILDNPAFPSWLQQKHYWCVSVQDNGIGIAADDRDRIFNLFEKGEHGGQYAGTGLGLALVKKIADNHGGLVMVSAGEDGGSIFSCYFPMA